MRDLYIFNFTSEIMMAAVLVFLLITCILQRRRMIARRPLLLLILSNLLLMMCQCAEWALMLYSGDQSGLTVPNFYQWKILTYTLDYLLGYLSSVSFYFYVREHIRDLYEQREQEPGFRWKPMPFLLAWGAVSTAVYGFFMTQDWFYYLMPDGSEWFHEGAYLVVWLMANVVTVFSVVTLVQHRKTLGMLMFWLLLFYKVSPIGLLIADLLNGTCMTYLMRAFYTFILYVHVDLRSEREAIAREARLARQESELTELRTQIMLSQMQPHFLYNTLTTISGLCYLGNADQAKEVVDTFAAYFRQNMDSMGKNKFIPFEKELEHIKAYLWIEKVRFEDDLNVEYKIGPSNFQLPSLSLQPLVENAVKHGICHKDSPGTVTIETRETDREFQIVVTDDGVGFDPNVLPQDGRSHVGIENITARLETLSHGKLELRSTIGVGTVAVVHLPKEESKLNEDNHC